MEDIDVAPYLDVTGSKGNGDEYSSGAKEAQSLLRQLEWSKQAIFDEGMLLLMLCEGERDPHPSRAASLETSGSETGRALAKAALLARSLRAHIVGIQSVLDRLIGIAERQAMSRQSASGARLGHNIAQPTRNEHLQAGNHSTDALNGYEQPRRDSIMLPPLGIVDRPDSPLRVAEDTQAAAAQLQSMAMEIPRGSPPEGEFVDMEDAFSSPRRPLPQAPAKVSTILEKDEAVDREKPPKAASSTASMVTPQPPPSHRARAKTSGLDSDEGLCLLTISHRFQAR